MKMETAVVTLAAEVADEVLKKAVERQRLQGDRD